MLQKIKQGIWSAGVRSAGLARKVRFLQPAVDFVHKVALLVFVPPSTESMAILPHCARLAIPAGDPSTLTLQSGQYEVETTSVFDANLTSGCSFVDIGANIGYYTTLASALVGPGRVFAFEADPNIFSYLDRNVKENNCGNVTLVKKAVSDAVGEATFVTDVSGWGRLGEGGSVTVKTTPLDDYLKEQGWPKIDLIKIDVEGGEAAVLRGMTETVARNPAIKVIIEYCPRTLRRGGTEPSVFFHELFTLGLTEGSVIGGINFVILGPEIPSALRGQETVLNLLVQKPN